MNKIKEFIDFKDILNEVNDFESQFKDPASPTSLKKNLKPEDIMGKIGFRSIEYKDLDPDLKEGLQKSDCAIFCAHPIGEKGEINPNVVIMQNTDGSIIYFVQAEFGEYAISRAKKANGAYVIHELSSELGLTDILDQVSYYEIKQNKMPRNFRQFEGSDIRIPIPEVEAAEDTRKQLRIV